jgi:uncharacterized protein involved in exopolysaccharide biosynthesis
MAEVDMDGDISIYEVLTSLWRRRYPIIGTVLIVTGITGVISCFMPKQYNATSVILPPEAEEHPSSRLLASNIGSRSLPDLFAGKTTSDLIISMLKSRRIAEDAVKEFNLHRLSKKKYLSDTIRRLQSSIRISKSKEGAISVTVRGTNPELVADIANFYVSNLEKMNTELNITSAKPMVYILDRAAIPDKKSSPTIKLNMVTAGVVSLFVSIMVVFAVEGAGKMKKNSNSL